MYISIDFNSPDAIYVQLCSQIIRSIATEELREGDSLPSVRVLAEDVGVNMHTVNKAYALLRQEGFLKLDRRRGAVVAVNIDHLREMDYMRQQMREIVARALCKDLSAEEIHNVVDEVLNEFGVTDNAEI